MQTEVPPPAPPAILPHAPDTFCTYLARQLIAQRGYDESTIPEAAPLREHCDILLVRSDSMTCTLLCLVDREAHPGKSFDMSVDEAKAVAQPICALAQPGENRDLLEKYSLCVS